MAVGAQVQYTVAFQGGEEIPVTAFKIPPSSTALTSTRTLFQDACLYAMSAFISSGQNKEFGNDGELAHRVTQVAREVVIQIERYST